MKFWSEGAHGRVRSSDEQICSGRLLVTLFRWVALVAFLWAALLAAPAHAETCTGGTTDATTTSTTAQLESWIEGLPNGTVGCLRAGNYGNGGNVHLNDDNGGTNLNRVKIRTHPDDVALGNYATINARLTFGGSAGFYTYRLLNVNSTGQSGIGTETINIAPGAIGIFLTDLNITNGGADTPSCVTSSGSQLILQRSIIHNCGASSSSTANLDQCLYISGPGGPPWGAGATVTHNLVYDCAANAIQVYPNGDEADVAYNTLDSSGFGAQIGGDGNDGGGGLNCKHSDFVDFSNNAITRMGASFNGDPAAVDYWGCSYRGVFDYFTNNCFYSNAHGNYRFTNVSASGNIDTGATSPYSTWPHVSSGSSCYAKTGDPVSEIIIPLPNSP